MSKLSKKEKQLRTQKRQEKRALFERQRKRKFKRLKNTGEAGRYLVQKQKPQGSQKLKGIQIKEVSKPKIFKHEKLSLWKRIKKFIAILRKIFRR